MVLGGGCFLPKLSQSAGPGTQVWCMNNITIMSNYSTIKLRSFESGEWKCNWGLCTV